MINHTLIFWRVIEKRNECLGRLNMEATPVFRTLKRVRIKLGKGEDWEMLNFTLKVSSMQDTFLLFLQTSIFKSKLMKHLKRDVSFKNSGSTELHCTAALRLFSFKLRYLRLQVESRLSTEIFENFCAKLAPLFHATL